MDNSHKPVALVTGATRGFGRAAACALAARGHHVIAAGRTVGALEELNDDIERDGGAISLAVFDLADQKAIRGCCASIAERWNRLDLLVHAAAYAPPLAPVAHGDRAELALALEINCLATACLIEAAEPLLSAATNGTAIFCRDRAAGHRFFGAYGCSKAAQIALAASWQAEAERIGPRVVIFTPRPMNTALRSRFFPGEDRQTLLEPAQEVERMLAEL